MFEEALTLLDLVIIHGLILNIDFLNFVTNQNTETAVSYRRNRDYSNQFDWTYKLKEDLYGG